MRAQEAKALRTNFGAYERVHACIPLEYKLAGNIEMV